MSQASPHLRTGASFHSVLVSKGPASGCFIAAIDLPRGANSAAGGQVADAARKRNRAFDLRSSCRGITLRKMKTPVFTFGVLAVLVGGCGDGKASDDSTSWIVYLLVGAVVFQAVVLVGIHLRRRRASKQETSTLRCRCPGCKQKVSYRAKKAGQEIRCSTCQKKFALPTT